MAKTYKVETVKSKMLGDKMDAGAVEKMLNQHAKDGWVFKSVVETEVKGRIGPGGTMGLMFIFEKGE